MWGPPVRATHGAAAPIALCTGRWNHPRGDRDLFQPLPDMRPTQLPGMGEEWRRGFPEEAATGWVDWDVWKEYVTWMPDLLQLGVNLLNEVVSS